MGSAVPREEEVKHRVARQWFAAYDTAPVLGDIDFAVAVPQAGGAPSPFETEYLLWAEAKRGTQHDISHSLAQLIITIGKARTFEQALPPAFLGAFDEEKIAFLPYYRVSDIFYLNDFNWNVTPSDHTTREFAVVADKVAQVLGGEVLLFRFADDAAELQEFIRRNFVVGKSDLSRVRINKNNFTTIYQKWRAEVMPTIAVRWEEAKKQGIIDADFYLADILSEHNSTLLQRLYVLLRGREYEFARRTDDATLFNSKLTAGFTDGQEAHRRFWARYDRPPLREYWDYIVERRDLLVPQDVRERKGSFFTPQRWVELSQQYLADELGDDWQDRYYIWDCCAGTGNLLAGLTNKYNIYASTLDQQDVDVMRERIQHMNEVVADTSERQESIVADASERQYKATLGGVAHFQGGSNLLDSHVFQFDFLNDPFFDERDRKGRLVKKSKVPDSLQRILADPEERRRLVIYINPPYAEATNARTVTGTGENRVGLSCNNSTYERYKDIMGKASNELFAQFFIRIYCELRGSTLAEFSKLKILQASSFREFRKVFRAKLGRFFLVPANTFDNVRGEFPIGFFIWHTTIEHDIGDEVGDVYNREGDYIGQKHCFTTGGEQMLNRWLDTFKSGASAIPIGYMPSSPSDFQHNNQLCILSKPQQRYCYIITRENVRLMTIYHSVRHCIDATWLNDRDQFLYPNDGWREDYEFQTDCLVFTLFHGQNRISGSTGGSPVTQAGGLCSQNHWIPFTEEEVGARERFDSHLMSDYLRGVLPAATAKQPAAGTLFDGEESQNSQSSQKNQSNQNNRYVPLEHLSAEAAAVMDAGRELWRYYHQCAGTGSTGGSPVAGDTGRWPVVRASRPYSPNASFYDIRLFFQGTKTTKGGKEQMYPDSDDPRYRELIAALRTAQRALAQHIAPKVYAYGFLRQ